MNHISLRNVFLLLASVTLISSCSTPLQEVIYLDNIETGQIYENNFIPEAYKIRANDQLFIQVISDNPLDAAFLNLNSGQTNATNTVNMELITYMVNEDGIIDYPYLGEIKVIDLTVSQIKEKIQKEVDKYLTGAAVFVKQVNRTITVLGEVKRAGQQEMVKNRLTIFEALGTAGDLTDWGNRKNIKLIRELSDGKHIYEMDLTDPDLINSPYYYILPHDVLYVEHRTRIYGAKNLAYSAPIAITASLLSIGLLILNLLK